MACESIIITPDTGPALTLGDGIPRATDAITWVWQNRDGWDGPPPVRLTELPLETPEITSLTRDARTVTIEGIAFTPTPALYYSALNTLDALGEALIGDAPGTLDIGGVTSSVLLNDTIATKIVGEQLAVTFTIVLYQPDPAKV